jgi:hypothetical protein
MISYALYPNEAAMRQINSVPGHSLCAQVRFWFSYLWSVFFILLPIIIKSFCRKEKIYFFSQVSIIILLVCFAYHTILFYFLPQAMRERYPSLLVMFFTW